MIIPEALLAKTNKPEFQRGRIQRILEEGWNYLRKYFHRESEYFDFLENMSQDQFEDFLHTIFFYWAHDLYRIPENERISNLDGFMYQITLSIIEYLNHDIINIAKERIKNFFQKYFSPKAHSKLNKTIMVRNLGKNYIKLEFWEILYDMRNEFIHKAQWFNLIDSASGAFASIDVTEHRSRDGIYTQYIADIRIQFGDYMGFFWEAYLKYFGKK